MGRAQKRTKYKRPTMDRYLRKAYHKADKELAKETAKQVDIVFGAALLIFWEKYGWREKRCLKIMQATRQVWDEVAEKGTSMSMLEFAEKEIGIEFSIDGVQSYHTKDFLDGSLYDPNTLSIWKLIDTRQQQKEWIPLMLTANLCVALKRAEGFGFNRLVDFCRELDEFRKLHDDRFWYLEETNKRGLKWLILEGLRKNERDAAIAEG